MRQSQLRGSPILMGMRSTAGLLLGNLVVLVGVMAAPSGASGPRVASPSALPEPPTISVPQLAPATMPQPPVTPPTLSLVTLAAPPPTTPPVPPAALPVWEAAAPPPSASEPATTTASTGRAGAALAPAASPASRSRQAPERASETRSAPRRGLARALRAARLSALFLVLAAGIVVFLAVQARLDRRDPKLAAAPIKADTIRFS